MNDWFASKAPLVIGHRGARRHQFRIHVWTVNEPAEARRLVRLGVHGIITNKPKIIRESIPFEKAAGANDLNNAGDKALN